MLLRKSSYLLPLMLLAHLVNADSATKQTTRENTVDFWRLQIRYWDDSEIEYISQVGDTDVKRNEYSLQRQWQSDELNYQASYAHQPVLIRSHEPAHNGYFHQLDLQLQRYFGDTEITVRGGVHGSSNMFKRADFHGDAAVFNLSVLHSLKSSNVAIGLNGDHRFGHFQVYPRIKFQKFSDAGSELLIDLPVSVSWKSADRNLGFAIERYGEKWAALDSERIVETAFYLQEWRGLASKYIDMGRHMGYVELGYSFSGEVEYFDLGLGRQRRELDNSLFVSVGMELH